MIAQNDFSPTLDHIINLSHHGDRLQDVYLKKMQLSIEPNTPSKVNTTQPLLRHINHEMGRLLYIDLRHSFPASYSETLYIGNVDGAVNRHGNGVGID